MNTQKLRELALGAGSHEQQHWDVIGDTDIVAASGHWMATTLWPYSEDGKADECARAAYIAAACPTNILALLDSRDALLAAIEDVIGFIPEHRQRALRSAITKAEAL